MAVEIGHVDGVEVDYLDVTEAGEGQVFEEFAAKPPDPMRRMREVRILERRGEGRADWSPVRIGGVDVAVAVDSVVMMNM